MADPYTDLADRLEGTLVDLVEKQEVSLEASGLILTTVNLELKNIQQSIIDDLQEKISSWEESMQEDDKSLYSLGLRHALDIVNGVVPTDPSPGDQEEQTD